VSNIAQYLGVSLLTSEAAWNGKLLPTLRSNLLPQYCWSVLKTEAARSYEVTNHDSVTWRKKIIFICK